MHGIQQLTSENDVFPLKNAKINFKNKKTSFNVYIQEYKTIFFPFDLFTFIELYVSGVQE